MLIER
jgi:hypothetical protein